MKKIAEQHFFDLLSLQLSGDATAEQLALLQEQLLLNPQWQFLYDQLMQPPHVSSNPDEQARQAYATHFVNMQLQGKFDEQSDAQQAAEPHAARPFWRRMAFPLLMAASVTGLLFCIQFFFSNKPVQAPPAHNEIATRKGSKTNIRLPDGTAVWLNADSKLTYAAQFIGKTREVTLTGEAYFDVAHDTSHPFIIHAGHARIKVLGTAFNVRNYPQDKTWETTLMRGKIEVSMDDRPEEKIILKPLEKLIIAKDQLSIAGAALPGHATGRPDDKMTLTAVSYFTNDSLVAETSWVNDKLVFINEPLNKIAEELERQFAVTIVFKTGGARNYRYTGDFEKESLDKILQILSMSKEIRYAITDSTVLIE